MVISMPCCPRGQPCVGDQEKRTSTSVVDGCHATKDESLLVIDNELRGVSGSTIIPVISTFVLTSQATGLTWFGLILGGAFIKSKAPVVSDHEDSWPRASTALERRSYFPAAMSIVGNSEYSLPSFAEPM